MQSFLALGEVYVQDSQKPTQGIVHKHSELGSARLPPLKKAHLG